MKNKIHDLSKMHDLLLSSDEIADILKNHELVYEWFRGEEENQMVSRMVLSTTSDFHF